MKLALTFILPFVYFAAPSFAQNAAKLRQDLASAGVAALFKGDDGFATSILAYNKRFTFTPIGVAFPTSPQQVSASIKAGTAQSIQVIARSGGHSYIANGLGGDDGALVIDLSKLKSITYDSATTHATIQTGLRLGDIARALNDHGRSAPHGRCTFVGIGGHSGFGGFGFVSRMWGLTLDVVQSATVVLANGTITTASSKSNPDLYWAIRGSSASFGIVTSIEVKTFPAPDSTIFTYDWDLSTDSGTSALSNWQSFVDSGIPATLGGELVFTKGPSLGTVHVQFFGGYYGPVANFNATIKPFMDTFKSTPIAKVTSGDWLTGLQALVYGPLDTSTEPLQSDTFYAKSLLTPQAEPMTYEAMHSFVNYLATKGFNQTGWFVECELYGGSHSAINAVPLDSTAFAHRSTRFNFQLYTSSGSPPFPDSDFSFTEGMAQSIVSKMPRDWDYGAYVNYADDRLVDWQKRYYGPHYRRLIDLKHKWDSRNVFHFPTSIQ